MLAVIVAAGLAAGQTADAPGDPTRGLDPIPTMPELQSPRACPDPCSNYVLAD
jgi:hypothetical protein